jgi:hypothetical protein
MKTNQDYRELVKELCDLTEGLTAWECDFVSDMIEWTGQYTQKQKQTIEKIYDKVM